MKRTSSTPKIIKNYRYAVYLPKELPEQLWQQARSMNELWNEMVGVRDRISLEITKIRQETRQSQEGKELNASTDKPARIIITEEEKALWQDFSRILQEVSNSRQWKEKIGWEACAFVFEKFQTASARVFRERKQMRLKPKFLEKVIVPHRFTNGGWEAENVYAGRSKKLFIKPLPKGAFADNNWQSRRSRLTTGIYGLGIENTLIPFRILLHRRLPSDSLIKQTQLNGKFDFLNRRWTWYLNITCQTVPPEEIKPFLPIAAIDLNYRRIDDYLRIGYVVDSNGNQFEIRLPVIEKPSRRLLNTLKVVNAARNRQNLPEFSVAEFFPVTIFDSWEWQAKNDLLLEEFKETMANLLGSVKENLPEEVRQAIKNLPKMRRTGLLKLWHLTREAEDIMVRKIHQLLDNWKKLDLENLNKIKKTNTHLINKRNKAYENITKWLKSNYSHLVYEKDFSLRKIAEESPKISLHSKQIAIRLGAKYRNFAALSILRQKLCEHNTNGWLIGAEMRNTTRKCCVCEALCEQTGQLKITCPNGHEADQDYQACQNLLSEVPKDLIYDRSKTIPNIPAHLIRCIVPI